MRSSSTTSSTAMSRSLPSRMTWARGRVQHGEPVEHALGAQLLDDSDQRVADEHDSEERVLWLPDREDRDQQHAEDRVEAREEVGAKDLAEGAAAALATVVRSAPARRARRRRQRSILPPASPRSGEGAPAPDARQCCPQIDPASDSSVQRDASLGTLRVSEHASEGNPVATHSPLPLRRVRPQGRAATSLLVSGCGVEPTRAVRRLWPRTLAPVPRRRHRRGSPRGSS